MARRPPSGAPPTRPDRSRCGRGEHGAALVEMVIVLPIFLLLVFGIIEFSRAYHESAIVADAARAGGRIASTVPGTDYTATGPATALAAHVETAVRQLPSGSPRELWVYEANDHGYPGASGTTGWATCPTGTCVRYSWDVTTRTWHYASGSYPAANQSACGGTLDEIGVRVVAAHAFAVRLFGASVALDDRSIFRFEPATTC